MGCLIIISGVWALFGLMLFGSAWKEGFVFLLFVCGLFFLPFAFIVWLAARDKRVARERHAAAMALGGIVVGAGRDYSEGRSGVGINPATKTVVLWADGLSKAYPYDAIRAWETNSARAGQAIGVGVQGAVVAGAANIGAANAAAAASGLFVTVKDIEHPKWRVAMGSPQTQARWMEIFEQELNEGGIA